VTFEFISAVISVAGFAEFT